MDDRRFRHGVRAFLGGKLPASNWRVRKLLNSLRTALESEVVVRRGEIDVYAAALIQSAIRHEGVCALWAQHLKDHGDVLTLTERLNVCKEIRNATDARDRCLEKLGLNRFEGGDVIDAIYSQPTEGAEHGAEV
jgi:hypothetical protein